MLWHPLIITLLVVDCLATLLLLAAGVRAWRVTLGWVPLSSDPHQLLLEVEADGMYIQAYWALGLGLGTSLGLIVAVANILPPLVAGAMCGTGVLQATNGLGTRALWFRLLAIFLLGLFCQFDRINRTHPEAPATLVCARFLLLAVPVWVVALFHCVRAMLHLEHAAPVDCCAVVYDQTRLAGESWLAWQVPENLLVPIFLGLSLVLVVTVVGSFGGGRFLRGGWRAVAGGLSMGWCIWGTVTLIHTLAAYFYQVLHHRCPWCLCLADHWGAGFGLFGALLWVGWEGILFWLLPLVLLPFGDLRVAIEARLRTAGFRMIALVLFFLLLAGGPALVWRWRYGVWMG